jgi:3D-(3,5/4)-trihydroxycyclohexane-1,2-dione acylhydrolase (decyclizing)
MKTITLTVAQALLKFLANQYVAIDNEEHRFVHGVWGIFGHGNVTGLGEALEFNASGLTYYQGHNEQGMAHAAIAFAKQKNRLGIFACTSSIGPGATNMVTAAATATTNRIPLLLLPGDIFSCRQPDPVLQQLEVTHDYTVSVNDCFKPVSKYWDRISRPEQLMTACINAFRVLTDPAETGAVTLCLPQDVQAESYAYPEEFFQKRIWHIDRQKISERLLNEAAQIIISAKQPLIIAGGGIHYSLATDILATFAINHSIPVAETQAGKSALSWSHPMNVGGIGVTGSEAANKLAAEADVILVVGSRLQDFTTASKWGFQQAKIIHININRFDSLKMDAIALHGDAKEGLEHLNHLLGHYQTSEFYQNKIHALKHSWNQEINKWYTIEKPNEPGLPQTTLLGYLNQIAEEDDVIICAAGSLPGDLHRLWRSKKAKDYHVEYAYSCMGYEVAAGLGVRLAKQTTRGEVYVVVGDGSFLMLHSELLTSIQENKKVTIIVFDNHGYQCIRNLQEANGSEGFGNEFRFRNAKTNKLDGRYTPIDFCQYATALGAKSFFASSIESFTTALIAAKHQQHSCVIVVPTLAKTMSRGYETWWRVGVAATSQSERVLEAHQEMCQKINSIKLY